MMPSNAVRAVFWLVFLTSLSTAACNDATAPSAGNRLAFASIRDGNWNIYSADPDGSNVRRLTADPATDIQPAISTDRKHIAFYSERSPAGIYVMNADGSSPHLVRAAAPPIGAEHMSWSPDDRFIAYQGAGASGDGYAIHALDITNGSDHILEENAVAPAWSPDGTLILFTDASVDEIWVMDRDGSNPRFVLADGREGAWSPDGQHLAFVSGRDGALRLYIVRSVDVGGLRRLTNAATGADRGPDWSPDGTRIAFTRDIFPTADVWTIDADGSDEQRVTNGPATNGGVTW